MFLQSLGWNDFFEKQILQTRRETMIPARVSEEFRDAYCLICERGELHATIAGKIRFHAQERSDFPAVGDWVLARIAPENTHARIEAILERRTSLSRKVAGTQVREQVLAANVDTVFVVTSLNQELNARRIERYLSLVWQSGATPVIVLTKADLCPDAHSMRSEIELAAMGTQICITSTYTGEGLDSLVPHLKFGRTVAFVGSSGVGKSSLINILCGEEKQKVNEIRASDDRGRHTTTTRQMILLPQGGIVIDTPGMRELQLWDASNGFSNAFADVEQLALNCKFRNCRHQAEPGCAVIAALENGALPRGRFANYEKLQAELRFLQTKTSVHHRQKAKSYAKRMCKEHKRSYKNFN